MKKKLFILTFLITSISNSQSWNYKTVINDFDGKYKMARVYGTGGEFPYKKPDLVVFKRSNGTMAIYISGIGYSGCDNRFVYFKFNGDEKKYKTNYVASGANDDAWFISSMKDISKGTLLTKFTKYNYVSVRIGSNCGLNDYRFSLEGSTKAINYVFGENYIINLQKEKAILRDLEKKKKERERVHKKHINNKIKNFNITTDDKERLLKRIIKKYSESDVNLLEVDSINIKGKDVFFDIELFDLLKEKIGIIKSVILPSVVILKFSDLQQSQIELPLGSLEKQKSEAESLLKEKKYLKLSKKAFYFNKTDIKAYANIYNIKYEFIVPRETLIAIDEDYFEANYFKIKYVIKSYLFVKIYVKKENLVKLIL